RGITRSETAGGCVMGKLDELRRIGKRNAAESMGVFAGAPAIPGVSPPGPSPVPLALQGVAKVKNVAAIPVEKIDRDPGQPRDDLRPIEQARAFKTLIEQKGWSTRQLARELAIAQPQVVRMLSLLELPAPVQDRVEQGALAPATAYEIGKLENPAEQQELAER